MFFLLFNFAYADTEINGDIIETDTVWTKDASPYLVNQTSIVDSGATLTIEPGVVIKFTDGQSLTNFGTINAIGNVSDKIVFTSQNSAWSGIFSAGGEMRFDNAVIENVSDVSIETAFGASTTISNSTIQNTKEAFEIYNDSDFILENSSVTGINHSSFNATSYIYNDSNLSILNSSFDAIQSYFGIVGFNDAHIIFSSSTLNFSGSSYALDIYGSDGNYATSTLDIDKSIVNAGGDTGVFIMGKAEANISKTKVRNSAWDGIDIYQYGGFYPNVIITDSEISNNFYAGISNFTGNLKITNSSIFGNSYYGLTTDNNPNFSIIAENNWWGDASGPYNENLNPTGLGDVIDTDIDFTPWLTSEPTDAPPIVKNVPIILIPGIMGSVLSKNYDDHSELWPNTNTLIKSLSDNFMDDLALTASGTEDISKPLQIGDIMRKVEVNVLGFHYTTHLFDGLIDTLESGGYVEGTDLFVFPYDWRKDNADNAILLKQKIDDVLLETGNTKVDLIAHSMGGLVAKKYIVDEGTSTIDKIFFIGTPHLGAPKAYKALMYGDDMGIRFGFSFLKPAEVKFISQNMPGVFELLPSENYLNINKYVYDDTIKNDWLNFSETENYMASSGRNIAIFPFADNFHNAIDSLDLTNLNSYNFSGCGTTKTIGQILTTKKTDTIKDKKIRYVNGDTTVPLISSNIPAKENYYVTGYVHSELPSANGVPQDILSIIQNGSTVADYANISLSSDICQVSGKAISVHSPVSLDVYDENNNHTGVNSDGNIEYEINGVSFDEIDGEKFAFLPDGINYNIILKGESAGTFDLSIEDVSGTDEITHEESWLNVPIQGTSSKFQIGIGTSTENFILADEDGNGDYENNLSEGYDGSITEILKRGHRRYVLNYGTTTNVLDISSSSAPAVLESELSIQSQLSINNLEKSISSDIVAASSVQPVKSEIAFNRPGQSRISINKSKKIKPITIISKVEKRSDMNIATVYESGGMKVLKSIWYSIINFIKKII